MSATQQYNKEANQRSSHLHGSNHTRSKLQAAHNEKFMRNTHQPCTAIGAIAWCAFSQILVRKDSEAELKTEKHQASVFLVSKNSVDDIRGKRAGLTLLQLQYIHMEKYLF